MPKNSTPEIFKHFFKIWRAATLDILKYASLFSSETRAFPKNTSVSRKIYLGGSFLQKTIANCESQLAFACSESIRETPEQCVKAVQS